MDYEEDEGGEVARCCGGDLWRMVVRFLSSPSNIQQHYGVSLTLAVTLLMANVAVLSMVVRWTCSLLLERDSQDNARPSIMMRTPASTHHHVIPYNLLATVTGKQANDRRQNYKRVKLFRSPSKQ